MKERPIIFNGEMVKAILDGRKTQTRRVVKPQPEYDYDDSMEGTYCKYKKYTFDTPYDIPGCGCAKYQPGDRLWVREKQRVIDTSRLMCPDPLHIKVRYMADNQPSGWIKYPARLKGIPKIGKCLSYGGYRESSRILLEVIDVRVERVQDITHTGALAEGVTYDVSKDGGAPLPRFQKLWNKINAKRGYGWDSNPWVWVVTFKRLEAV